MLIPFTLIFYWQYLYNVFIFSVITLVNTIFLARGLWSDFNCILAADSKYVISFCLSHQVFEQWDDERIVLPMQKIPF